MQTRVTVAVVVVLGFFAIGVVLTSITRVRRVAERETCKNNLREHSRFTQEAAALSEKQQKAKVPVSIPGLIPAGTFFVAEYPPEERLSWIADSITLLNPKHQNSTSLAEQLNRTAPWNKGTNLDVGKVRLTSFICPGRGLVDENPDWGVSHYVGAAGIGPGGPTATLGPPISPDAGCFRYDQATPLQLIFENDGLSQTIMLAEIATQVGPWIRGGPSTIRPFDPDLKNQPVIGTDGQFGGNHLGIAQFGFADGSVRPFTITTSPDILRSFFSIAGGGREPIIGE